MGKPPLATDLAINPRRRVGFKRYYFLIPGIFYLLAAFIAGCCGGKCDIEPSSSKFRIIDHASGANLLFGATKIYNADSIKIYSIEGHDTIYHVTGAGINNYPDMDSVLFVNFDYRHIDTAYVMLNHSTIDTLVLNYEVAHQSHCCPGYTDITRYTYNHSELAIMEGGIVVIRK